MTVTWWPATTAARGWCTAWPWTSPRLCGACEDYRASATIDLEHDRASRLEGRRIECDLHVLWGTRGVINALFDPLALWRAQCSARLSGQALPAGHYLAEELPAETAQQLLAFFSG